MFSAYLDDSGTAPDQPIALCVALIIPGSQIPNLERQWEAFRTKQGFDDFHASECAYSDKHKIFGSWSRDKRERVFKGVREFCKRFGVQALGFAVNKKTFDEVMPNELKQAIGDDHYSWAVRNTATRVEEWRKIRDIKESVQYIFDWQEFRSPERLRVDAVMSQLSETIGERVNHDFKSRKEIPGLQCVDFLAWVSLNLALDNFNQKPMHLFADDALKDLERFNGGRWYKVATILRGDFEKWTKDEMSDGKSIAKLLAWKESHPELVVKEREKTKRGK